MPEWAGGGTGVIGADQCDIGKPFAALLRSYRSYIPQYPHCPTNFYCLHPFPPIAPLLPINPLQFPTCLSSVSSPPRSHCLRPRSDNQPPLRHRAGLHSGVRHHGFCGPGGTRPSPLGAFGGLSWGYPNDHPQYPRSPPRQGGLGARGVGY